MKQPIINKVKNRFLPLSEAVAQGLEPEPKIEDFELIKRLGEGSFGVVNLMVHKITKAQYAIKIINKRNKTNIEEKPYFIREIEIMYKVHHPNVVRLYGHFEDDNYCYFIMEYITKGNIFNLIPKDRTKRLSTSLVASIMKDVISAVYFLHNMATPIIHRDIKPENVLLDDHKVGKLTDFGWSNYSEGQNRTTVCGTPIYLAPEIVNESGHNEKVDLWCIGVLLFELATGNVPFIGNDFEQLKENIRLMKIEWPRDINSDAKDLIKKILKYNPNDRIGLVEMLSHPFFTNHIKHPTQYLIKPDETVQYEPFIVSKDNPKSAARIKKKADTVDNGNSSSNDNDAHVVEMYNEMLMKYQMQVKTHSQVRTGNEVNVFRNVVNKLNEDVNVVKKVVKEKENEIEKLMKGNDDVNVVAAMQEENKKLKRKVEEIEKNRSKGGNSSSNASANVDKDIEMFMNGINDDKKKLFEKIMNEFDIEVKNIVDSKEKDKLNHANQISDFNKALKEIMDENKELKKKIKLLETKK